ncbi:MAG: glycoside hydrolase family 2 protein [Lachnospiraceae bacterium]|nr:glycoside hydrolase family 2 protein [Lachnospiraceae bacterium]
MIRKTLTGDWTLYEVNCPQTVYPVTIPGSVLSAFLDAGVIPDHYSCRNEYRVLPLLNKDYCVERTFEVEPSLLDASGIDLVCEGIDTIGEIYINDILLASVDNMHRTWRFPVRSLLTSGANTIRVLLRSPIRASLEAAEQAAPHKRHNAITTGALPYSQYLRKAHCMSGWDWGPKLPDLGIWRPIYIEAYDNCRIEDVRIHQEHEGSVSLTASFTAQVLRRNRALLHASFDLFAPSIDNPASSADRFATSETLHALDDSPQVLCSEVVRTGEGDEILDVLQFRAAFRINEPQLWWPAGYGGQPLYTLTIRLTCAVDDRAAPAGAQYEEDCVVKQIGLRTLTVSTEKDRYGSEFAFTVNGVKIFAMGADYIPEDCILARITPARRAFLLDSCVKAHFNSIRVWGGGFYPDEAFLTMCDERGLIVWQDLMFACHIYDATDAFLASIGEEIRDNLSRMRHHACLGLICGNNELEEAWLTWTNFKAQSPYLKTDYTRMFEDFIPRVVKECAPDTFFWPSSPSSGGSWDDPDSEDRGDVHYWDVWHGLKPFTDYRKYYFRFCSEFGFQSFPSLKTVRTFAGDEDLNIFSPVMESHQKNPSANGKIMTYLSANFRYPKSFGDLMYVSQILQGCAIRYGVEHWRRYRGRCMGTMYWQLNDIWPAASWSSIDYENRWKALHYMAAHFYAPLTSALFVERSTDSVAERIVPGRPAVLCAMNETGRDRHYEAQISLVTMDFAPVLTCNTSGVLPAYSSRDILQLDLPALAALIPEAVPDTIFGGTSTVQNFFLTDASVDAEDREALPLAYAELAAKYSFPESGAAAENCILVSTVQFDDGSVSESVETLVPYKHLALPAPDITVHVTESPDGKSYEILLASHVFVPFVELDLDDGDAIFSDNYFSMVRERPYRVLLQKRDILRGHFTGASDIKRRLRIRSLRDTY